MNTTLAMQIRAESPDFRAIESPAIRVRHTAPAAVIVRPHSPALDLADRIINDVESSFWLKAALVKQLGRDPVDAVADTEILLSVLTARLEEIQTAAR